jgi:hypothetical protein
MREAAGNTATSFPIARCEVCDKSVLLYLAFTDDSNQKRLCVHCDNPVESDLVWVTADQLEAEGYSIGAKPSKGGCGGGCGSGCATRGH